MQNVFWVFFTMDKFGAGEDVEKKRDALDFV
jgi:hypothetical protein